MLVLHGACKRKTNDRVLELCLSLVNTLGSFTLRQRCSSDVSLKEKLVSTFYLCCRDIEKTNSESMADAVLSIVALQAALKIRKEQAGELIKKC